MFKFKYTSNDTDTVTCVCHADKTRCCVFYFKVLIGKVFPIDAYRSSTIMLDNISTWNTKTIKLIIIKASTSFLGNSYMQKNVPNHNPIIYLIYSKAKMDVNELWIGIYIYKKTTILLRYNPSNRQEETE